MKCLTFEEVEKWLSPSGVRMDGYVLRFRGEDELGKIMTNMPKGARSLRYLSTRLAEWVCGDAGRMLWMSNWETSYPSEPSIQFETMRLGCGEPRKIIDAPGHLFEQSNERENAVLAGLLFLIMAYNWECYLVPQNRDEFVYLGDEHIVFWSADADKMKNVAEIISTLKMKQIKEISEAWS